MSSQDALDSEQSVLLSDATLSALQLVQQPFGPVAPEETSFSDEITAEQLADIKQALITGDDLLLILGEPGAGKTTLLRQLSENSGLRIQCFSVKGTDRFSTLNLFAGMLEAFKRPSPEKLKDILDELIPCLQTMVTRNTLSAIVLDDAHMINETELTQLLSSMLYINSQDETLMRVTLAAPDSFEERIPELLPEGADLPYSSLTIEGMSPPRAASYLEFRLQQAGFEGEWPFTDSELDQLAESSGGLPQPFNALVASELNQQFGPLEETMPVELLTETDDSFLHTRTGKLALGLVATVFIIGGLSMFMSSDGQRDTRMTVAQQSRLELSDDTPKLQLIEEKPVSSSTVTSSAATQATETANSSTSSSDGQVTDTPDSTASDNLSVTDNAHSDSENTATAPDTESAQLAQTIPVAHVNAATDTAATTEPLVASNTPAVVTTSEPAITSATELAAAAVPADPVSSAVTELVNAADNPAASNNSPTDAELLASNAQPEEETPSAATPEAASPNNQTTDEAGDATPVDAGLANVLESPTWILVQDSRQFTVQMSASRDRPSVENFLKRNAEALGSPNSIYTFVRNEDTWYALVHGLFPSIAAAREAVEKLPAGALTNQPWIRNIGRVQDALKAQ